MLLSSADFSSRRVSDLTQCFRQSCCCSSSSLSSAPIRASIFRAKRSANTSLHLPSRPVKQLKAQSEASPPPPVSEPFPRFFSFRNFPTNSPSRSASSWPLSACSATLPNPPSNAAQAPKMPPPSSPATAACSTGSTACCSTLPSSTTSPDSISNKRNNHLMTHV